MTDDMVKIACSSWIRMASGLASVCTGQNLANDKCIAKGSEGDGLN